MFWGSGTGLRAIAAAAAVLVGACAVPWVRNEPPVTARSSPAIPPPTLESGPDIALPEPLPDTLPIEDLELWTYTGARLSLPRDGHKQIRKELAWFKRNRGYTERVSERAAPISNFVTRALEERGLPLDLALLPIIESAYRPQAVSKIGAGGLWQFIPSTDRNFGLEQNW